VLHVEQTDTTACGPNGDLLASGHIGAHSFRLARPLLWLLFVSGAATPTLHSQESTSQQQAVDQMQVLPIGVQDEPITPTEAPVAAAPKTAPSPTKEDRESEQVAEPQTQSNSQRAPTDQPVTWKNLPMRVLGDQKEVWLFPVRLAQGKHWLPTLGTVGVTGALIASDPPIMRHLRNTSSFDEFDEVLSGPNTGVVTALIPVTFYTYGLIRKRPYEQQTALLAGEAYLDSAIPGVAMKLVSRRLRPSAVPPTSDFSDTFFASHVSVFGKGSSFSSGHAAGIFSISTVIAERYGRQHRWVPWVVYGLAGAISFSRVPTFAHFPSDVFVGAILGYTITRYDVLRDRTH
jgi:hypothetical protein